MIRQFADQIDYARIGDRNRLTLMLKPESESPDAALPRQDATAVPQRRERASPSSASEYPLDALQQAQLLRGVPPDRIADLMHDCRRKTLCSGDYLIAQGQINHQVYIVLSGQLSVALLSDGSRVELALDAGECVGEMSVIDGKPASASVLAKTDAEVLAIPEEVFWSRLVTQPRVARNLMSMMSQRIRRQNAHELEILGQELRYLHLAKEIGVAHDIQMSMLPQPPLLDGHSTVDVDSLIQTAEVVGGDFYDTFSLDEERICLIVGDVSGKGIPAALFMMRVLTLLRTHIKKKRRLEKSLFKVNNLLRQNNPTHMFVTALIVVVDLTSGRATWVNAGHSEPVLLRSSASKANRVKPLRAPKGILLGVQANIEFKAARVSLRKQDTLMLYTDGVTEAENSTQEQFGEERLMDYLGSRPFDSATDLVRGVREQLNLFVNGAQASDDITLLALVFREPKRRRVTRRPKQSP